MNEHIIRVMVADDHPIIIEGTTAYLTTRSHLQVVGVAKSYAALRDLLATTTADVLILDLSGMGEAPITMVTQLRAAYPQLQIVVFSAIVSLAPDLLAAGASGYVVKEELTEQLLAAIEAASRNETYRSRLVEAYLARLQSSPVWADLSAREQAIMRLLVEGSTTVAIAEALRLDPRTVQNQIVGLQHKTGLRERAHLIAWYRRHWDGSA